MMTESNENEKKKRQPRSQGLFPSQGEGPGNKAEKGLKQQSRFVW